MKVKLSKNLLEYLEDKKATQVTVDKINNKTCCGSGLPSSDVYFGPSKRRDRDYNIYNEANIEIFVDKDLFFVDDICYLDVVKLPFTRSLVANFLDYKKLI